MTEIVETLHTKPLEKPGARTVTQSLSLDLTVHPVKNFQKEKHCSLSAEFIMDPRTVQELWKQALGWDETLSETKQQVWYKLHLTPSPSLTIPRFFLNKTCHTDGMIFTIYSETSEKRTKSKKELKAEEINQAKMM